MTSTRASTRIIRNTLIGGLLLTLPLTVWAAANITIVDAAGVTRAQYEGAANSSITLNINDAGGVPADGATVTLTNTVTNEKLTAVTERGVAKFPKVGVGTWTLSTEQAGLVLASASFLPVGSALGGAALAVGGIGAIIVGGNEIADAADGDGPKEATPLSPAS